jgi:hypothetical protein
VNGHRFECTIVQSIFLSPAVEEMFLSDSCSQEFHISDSSIDSNDFSILLDFIPCDHNRDSISLSASTFASLLKTFSNQKSLLSICQRPKNKQLELIGLNSFDNISRIAQSGSDYGSEIDVDCCSSEFYSYPTSAILELSIDTPNAIPSSNSLRIIKEDWLLKVLIEIGHDHSFQFGDLRLKYLSCEGNPQFCDVIDDDH